MPCFEQRSSNLLGIQLGVDIANVLSFPDNFGEGRCPLGKNLAETMANEFAVLCGFQRHIPCETSIPPPIRCEKIGNPGEVGTKAL